MAPLPLRPQGQDQRTPRARTTGAQPRTGPFRPIASYSSTPRLAGVTKPTARSGIYAWPGVDCLVLFHVKQERGRSCST